MNNQSLQAQMHEITPTNKLRTDRAKTTAANPKVALRHWKFFLS